MTKNTLDDNTCELLELVRLLEQKDYFDPTALKQAAATAKTKQSSPFDKLICRALWLDEKYQLSSALKQIHHHFGLIATFGALAYFILGVISVFGLLALPVINFFYLFIALLGWHSVSLFLWILGTYQNKPLFASLMIDKLIKKLTPDDTVHTTAHAVIMNAKKPIWQAYISSLLHKAWLFGLLGNFLGLLGLFLVQRYTFTWQSTLLDNHHLMSLLQLIGYLPSLVLPSLTLNETTLTDAKTLGLLTLVCVVFYGILPRALAWAYTEYRCRYRTKLDKTLYYYENLLRFFSRDITDSDNYQPPKPKPALIRADKVTAHKLVVVFETAFDDPFWYQYRAGNNITDIGVIDTQADLDRLQIAIKWHNSSVYLGIDTCILPDRGAVRKLCEIQAISEFGLAVELLGKSAHTNAWQAVLTKHHIMESR